MKNNIKSNETRSRTHILELTAELVKITNANISEDDLSAAFLPRPYFSCH